MNHIVDVYLKFLHSNFDPSDSGVCVLAVDMQENFRRDNWPEKNLDNAREFMQKARNRNVPIIHLKYSGPHMCWFIEGLEPKFGEHVIYKEDDDGFKGTNLNRILESMYVENIYLLGGNAGACVKATFDSAIDQYKITIISDALMAEDDQHIRRAIDYFEKKGAVITSTRVAFLR